MHQVRHSECKRRLFDTPHFILEVGSERGDVKVKCDKCKTTVGFIFRLPRWRRSGKTRYLKCEKCGKRLMDVTLEYEQVSSHTNADIVVECKECKRLNKIIFSGIAGLSTKPA